MPLKSSVAVGPSVEENVGADVGDDVGHVVGEVNCHNVLWLDVASEGSGH